MAKQRRGMRLTFSSRLCGSVFGSRTLRPTANHEANQKRGSENQMRKTRPSGSMKGGALGEPLNASAHSINPSQERLEQNRAS
jgi:hypothetical protein